MKLCLRMPLHLIYNVPRDALDKNFKCWKVLAVPDRNSDHGHTAVADPHGTHQHGDCLEDGRMLVESVIETVLAADPPPYSEQGKTRGRKPKRDSAPGSKKRKGGKKSRKTKTGKAKQASKSKKSKATPVDTAPVSGDVEVGIASSSNGTGTAIAPKKPKKSRKEKTEDARHAAMNEPLSNPETSNCREASKPATHKGRKVATPMQAKVPTGSSTDKPATAVPNGKRKGKGSASRPAKARRTTKVSVPDEMTAEDMSPVAEDSGPSTLSAEVPWHAGVSEPRGEGAVEINSDEDPMEKPADSIPAPTHCTNNGVHSSAYKRALAKGLSKDKAKENGKLESKLLRDFNVVSPDLSGVPRQPRQSKASKVVEGEA